MIFQRLQLKENVEKLYPFQLSGGMARRVLVSTAVLSGADVIIADEPTPGLDLEMALETLKIFRELADEGFGALEVCGAFGENLAREMYQAADRRLTVSYVVCPKDQEEASLQFWARGKHEEGGFARKGQNAFLKRRLRPTPQALFSTGGNVSGRYSVLAGGGIKKPAPRAGLFV